VVDHEFPDLGRRRMLVNARRIERGDENDPLILLAFRDDSRGESTAGTTAMPTAGPADGGTATPQE
jgi:hypothetical protein